MELKKVGVLWNSKKPQGAEAAARLTEFLEKRGVSLYFSDELAQVLGKNASNRADFLETDLLITLGGDGTVLKALDIAVPEGIPMLGVNLGRVGFLTEVEPNCIEEDLARVLEGDFRVEERMTMQIAGEGADGMFALNEITVMRRDPSVGIISLELSADGTLIDQISGDGLIVASATGSTAYSLSAGGPIVAPELECFVLTPICPHTMNARPVVVSAKSSVTVRILDYPQIARAVFDGRMGLPFSADRPEITIRQSEKRAKFVRLHARNYYKLLHEKLSQWTHETLHN